MSHPTPTAVQQGSEYATGYPFVSPSDDIRGLLTDFYLAYPYDQDVELPLVLDWLYGAGTQPATPPAGTPTPTHAHDVVIKDSLGIVIFDSTVADYQVQAWGDRLIVQWLDSRAVCRLVIQDVQESDWPDHLRPEGGTLDGRTYHALPQRLTSLVVGETPSTGPVELHEGYNIGLVVGEVRRTEGGRRVTRVTINATPGLGLGTKPGCEDALDEILVRRLAGVGPDAAGNVTLDLADCYRVQLPVTSAAGLAHYGAAGLTATQSEHGLVLAGDCVPCCACEDYLNTYKGLKRVWDDWESAAATLESTRDVLAANKGRWEDYRECLLQTLTRLILLPEESYAAQVSASYCNASECCLANVEFRFTVSGSAALEVSDGWVDGSATHGLVPYTVTQVGNVFSVFFTRADPRELSLTRFRLLPTDTPASLNVQLEVFATVTGECTLPAGSLPGVSKSVTLNPAPRAYRCDY